MSGNQTPLVIYHKDCPDGFTAAWVAHNALGGAELFGGKYGEQPPYELAAERETYVVDFSYPRAQTQKLHAVAKQLLVLDHHKTAQAELEGLPYCQFDMQRSGARMSWDHFHPGEPPPWVVAYVEDRDLWRFSLPHSKTVSLRIRLTPHEIAAYDALNSKSAELALDEGLGAELYLEHYVQDALRNAYDLQGLFGDEACRCVNVSYTGVSDVLHGALAAGGVRVALAWHLGENGRINCSLRSTDDVDCSVFAKQHGGGGHAQASGCSLSIDSPLFQRLIQKR